MKYKRHLITLKLTKRFAIGFEFLNPKHNNFCLNINMGPFILMVWSKGDHWVAYRMP